jgi:hypothetical protein
MWHLLLPVHRRGQNLPQTGAVWVWLGDVPFYIADLLALPEIFQAVQLLVKPSIRPLSASEMQRAQRVFKDAVDYRLVRIDSRARVGIQAKIIAYVTFNFINFRGALSPEIFIHEMMHVWQFQQFGSVYLFRAMKAQLSHTVYDFGGIENLYQKMLAGKGLLDFNFEQQAEIIETYYVSLDQPDTFSTMERQVLAYFAGFLGPGT